VGFGGEASHVADRAHDPRGKDGTYAEDLYEAGVRSFDLGFYAPIEVCDLSLQCPDVAQDLRSQAPADARRGALRSYTAQDAGGSGSRECPRYSTGNEVPQESVQAVERSGKLGDLVFAPLRKETQHLRSSLGIDRRQPIVAPGGQRGGEGIDPVVLAGVASEAREHPHAC